MNTADFFSLLAHRLLEPLPGRDAHAAFVPAYTDARIRLSAPPPTARRSAVVIPLVEPSTSDLPDVLFTLRSAQLRNHSGQISFPGGRVDADEAPRDAALRELHEEIGVTVDPSNVLGALTDLFVPPSNSAIVPYVVRLPSAVTYHINEAEVQEVFTVPLRTFLTDDLRRTSPRTLNGITVDVPYWDVHPGQHLWGATAMILNELLWIVNDISL